MFDCTGQGVVLISPRLDGTLGLRLVMFVLSTAVALLRL